MMDELGSFTIFDYIQSREKSKLCRIVLFAETTLSGDSILKFFTEYAREHFSNRTVTGLMLVYSNVMVHLVESTEDEMFEVILKFINVEPKILGAVKYIPVEVGVTERFFDKWYGRKISNDFKPKCSHLEKTHFDSFEHVPKLYEETARNCYILFNELRDAKLTSSALFMEKLEQLGNEGNPHLPDQKVLRWLLLNTHRCWGRGESVDILLNYYWKEVPQKGDPDERIWPFQENGRKI